MGGMSFLPSQDLKYQPWSNNDKGSISIHTQLYSMISLHGIPYCNHVATQISVNTYMLLYMISAR